MFYLVLISLSAAVSNVWGACPDDARQRAMMCTAQLGITPPSGGSPSTFINEGDADRAIHACGNGDLLTAINCIERVMEECKHDNTDAAHFLRTMIDIEKARRSVNYFCTNVRVYTANAECIARHHKDQDICAQEARSNFQTQASATVNMDVLMRFQCLFFQAAVNCSEQVLREKCSSEAADIVRTVIEGVEPPICSSMNSGVKAERTGGYDIENDDDNRNGDGSLSAQFTIHVLALVSSVSFVLLLH